MRLFKILLTFIITFIPFELFAHDIASQSITVKSPLVAKKYLKNNATEVFMELINHSNESHELIAAISPMATQTQLHQSIHTHGLIRMKKINHITVKHDSEKDLVPGGIHVMLIGLKENILKNNSIPITLIFDDGSWMTVNATVG